LDVQTGEETARTPEQGKATIQHVETMFPFWFKQKESLKELTKDRREHHRNLANKNKTIQMFQPGDPALLQKQVNSNATKGKPAKLTLEVRGPHRILEEAGNNSCCIEKLPATQSALTRPPGKRMKELAMQMEKLPLSLVTHKQLDSLDAGLAEMEGELVSNPFERNLGFHDFRKCTMAPGDVCFAFDDKIGDLLNKEIQADLNSEDKAELESLKESDMELNKPEEPLTDDTVPKPACQEKKRLRQDQMEETKMEAKRAQPNNDTETTTASILKASWKDIQESTDKLALCRNGFFLE
jgi:HPt (histidine-containing phosphotransfer) domain-containing protein